MAKKKSYKTTAYLPEQASMFEVEAKQQVIVSGKSSKQKAELYTPYVDTFPHMEYGINKAYLAGESIISNRGNKI